MYRRSQQDREADGLFRVFSSQTRNLLQDIGMGHASLERLRSIGMSELAEFPGNGTRQTALAEIRELARNYDADGRRLSKFYPDPANPSITVEFGKDENVETRFTKVRRERIEALLGTNRIMVSDLQKTTFDQLINDRAIRNMGARRVAVVLWEHRVVLRNMPTELLASLRRLSPGVVWPANTIANPTPAAIQT